MTKNQTIDGVLVPRELLELAWLELVDTFSWAGEVRALLDAPAVRAASGVSAKVSGYTPGMGLVELRIAGRIPSWLELGESVSVFSGVPAAKSQGEPVHQWSDDDGISWCDGNEQSLQSARESGWKTRTLYTEQHAPAAHFCGFKIVEDSSLKPGEFRLSPIGKTLAD